MSSYFQMGHDTENLVGETDLEKFKGIILSPVNRTPQELLGNMDKFREKGKFDIILDPQLYDPRTTRTKLQDQPYFPSDFESTDIDSDLWWDKILSSLTKFATELNVDAIASPVFLPKIFKEDYYSLCAEVSHKLFLYVDRSKRILSTILVEGKQLTEENDLMKIASIISEVETDGYYLVILSAIDPRREFNDVNELVGIMNLIKLLENTGRPVLVSFCSSDMILFKAAGASNCATGKFFNLRRFTVSRFEVLDEGGGGQLPYWFEHSLLAFLRQADILRLRSGAHCGLIGANYSDNHWSEAILSLLDKSPGKAWLAMGWRQYLSWFSKTEQELATDPIIKTKDWLKNAEKNWLALEDDDVLMDEPRNDGSWIRRWRQAVNDFSKTL